MVSAPCQRVNRSYSGVMLSPMDMLTKQGYDLQFGTNVLGAFFDLGSFCRLTHSIGHFHFTKLVLPALLAAATPTEKARVITTSSSANYMGTLNFDLWADGPARSKKAPGDMYVQSKHVSLML